MNSDSSRRPTRLSLVIPTYCRPDFLKRLLGYFSSERADFSIYVIDSSPASKQEEIRKVVEAASDTLQVQWFHSSSHFPAGVEPLVHEKVEWGLSMVQTPYVAMCADDDFLVPSSLTKCVDFLDQDLSFSCARGKIYEFLVERATAKVEFRPVPTLPSIESNDTRERLWSAAREYQQTFYAVFRTPMLLDIERRLPLRLQRTPSWVDELAFTTLSAVFGKVARLDLPYEFRELHAENYGRKVPRWPEMLIDPEQRPFIDDYLTTLADALKDTCPNLQPGEAEKTSKESLIAFSKFYFDIRHRDNHCSSANVAGHQSQAPRKGLWERGLRKLTTLRSLAVSRSSHLRTQQLPEAQSVLQAISRQHIGP